MEGWGVSVIPVAGLGSVWWGKGDLKLTEAWLLVLPSCGQLAWGILLQMVEGDVGAQKQSRWVVWKGGWSTRVAVAGVNS